MKINVPGPVGFVPTFETKYAEIGAWEPPTYFGVVKVAGVYEDDYDAHDLVTVEREVWRSVKAYSSEGEAVSAAVEALASMFVKAVSP